MVVGGSTSDEGCLLASGVVRAGLGEVGVVGPVSASSPGPVMTIGSFAGTCDCSPSAAVSEPPFSAGARGVANQSSPNGASPVARSRVFRSLCCCTLTASASVQTHVTAHIIGTQRNTHQPTSLGMSLSVARLVCCCTSRRYPAHSETPLRAGGQWGWVCLLI